MARQKKEIVIPQSETRLEDLAQAINDASQLRTKQEILKGTIDEAIEGIAEEYELSKGVVRRAVNLRHRQAFRDLMKEQTSFADLYEALFPDEA